MISVLDLLVGWPFTMSAALVCAAIGYRLGGPGPAIVSAIVFGAAGFWADHRMGPSLPPWSAWMLQVISAVAAFGILSLLSKPI